MRVIVELYTDAPASYHEYDPDADAVARLVTGAITAAGPDLAVEHFGSTAVPGCAGKGVIDLMVLYPLGHLPQARQALDQLGFQRQTTRDPFPEDRPMRVGVVTHGGKQFRVHAHVLAVDSPEVAELRGENKWVRFHYIKTNIIFYMLFSPLRRPQGSWALAD